METNRTSLLRFGLAALAFCASSAMAQTIYKQVDAEGRVSFTDQPNPSAKVVASYETARRMARARADEDPGRDEERAATESRNPAPLVMPDRPASRAAESFPPMRYQTYAPDSEALPAAAPVPAASPAPVAAARRASNDVEKAVFSYAPLESTLAYEVDAREAARARQAKRVEATPVLVVKPLPREREPVKMHEDFNRYYVMWALTFFLMAAGLLYVGWQVMRLILGGAFPRWNVGIA